MGPLNNDQVLHTYQIFPALQQLDVETRNSRHKPKATRYVRNQAGKTPMSNQFQSQSLPSSA